MQVKNCSGNGLRLVAVVPFVLLALLLAPLPAQALARSVQRSIDSRVDAGQDRERLHQAAETAIAGGVAPEVIGRVADASLDGGVSAQGLISFMQRLAEAAQGQLPVEPLADKILEGIAKGVGERKIAMALGSVAGRLDAAENLVADLGDEPEDRDDLIVSTADAMAAGMSSGSLRRVFAAMAGREQGSGLAPDKVLEMVKTASGYGVDESKLTSYAESLARSRDAGEDDIHRVLDELARVAREGDEDGLDEMVQQEEEQLESDDDEEVGEEDGHGESDDGSGAGEEEGSGDEDSDGDSSGSGSEPEDD